MRAPTWRVPRLRGRGDRFGMAHDAVGRKTRRAHHLLTIENRLAPVLSRALDVPRQLPERFGVSIG